MARREKRNMPSVPTSERLACDLEAAGAPREMIERARRLWYDNYKSPLPVPLGALINDARHHGLPHIAEAAMRGEYDGSRAEMGEWERTEEGRTMLEDLDRVATAMRRDQKRGKRGGA